MAKINPPENLGSAGIEIWNRFTEKYSFRGDELLILERACREFDRISLMEDELGNQVTATGSMGQVVVHPLIAEIRAHEAQAARMLAQLKIPDDPAGAIPETRSTAARKAAQSRWAAAHGAAS